MGEEPRDRVADAVYRELLEEWRELRNDALYYDCAAACVRFARRAGLLSAEAEELWLHVLTVRPGHDDEGGRSWCAYCGEMEDAEELGDG